MKFEAFEKVNN